MFDSRVKTSVPLRRGAFRVGNNERRRDHGEGFEKLFLHVLGMEGSVRGNRARALRQQNSATRSRVRLHHRASPRPGTGARRPVETMVLTAALHPER